jgi:hypothetical protein
MSSRAQQQQLPSSASSTRRNQSQHRHALIHCRTDYVLAGFILIAAFFSIILTWNVHKHMIHGTINVNDKGIGGVSTTGIGRRERPHRTPKDDAPRSIPHNDNGKDYDEEEDNSILFHFITSTECSSYNVWETITQIHSAEAVRQCGKFTWIVSGCLPHDRIHHGKGKSGANSDILSPEIIQQHVDMHFPAPGDGGTSIRAADCSRIRPELHFTPDFSNMSVYGGKYADGTIKRVFHNPKTGKEVRSTYGNRYVFNNKPNGLLHWATEHKHDDDVPDNEVIVLIDPDFLFLTRFHLVRPGTTIKKQKQQRKRASEIRKDSDLVYPGMPCAASYGLGAQWLDFNLTEICGPNSHCTNATSHDVSKYYSAGPPYVIHRADVLPLATKWASLVPPTYDVYPLLYAEMYAYSMAAAHLQLKHNLINGLFTGCMVGWPNPPENKSDIRKSAEIYRTELAAELQQEQQQQQQPEEERSAPTCFVSPFPPPMLHYCNRYMVETTDEMKKYDSNVTYRFFAKRRVAHDDVLACDDDGNDSKNNGRFLPFASSKDYERMAGGDVDWNSLAVCAITRALNYARATGCSRRQKGK